MTDAAKSEPNFEEALTVADSQLGRVIAAVFVRIGRQEIIPSRTTPFEALVRAVIYQSLSGKAATAIFGRLQQAVGKPFNPVRIMRMTEPSILAVGLSRAKLHAIRNLAEWFAANRMIAAALPDLPGEDVVSALTGIVGIGAWTANVFLIFNLGRLDVMPATDLGVATPKQVQEKAERWRPLRSIASVYLWNAVKLKISARDLRSSGSTAKGASGSER
jgi:DNA-3-methyladenine glycosylase II